MQQKFENLAATEQMLLRKEAGLKVLGFSGTSKSRINMQGN